MRRGRSSIPQEVRERLGENIRRARVIRKMTQAELAEKIGTSQIMVSRFEKGKDSPSVWRCYRIAKVFGTTIEQLLTEPS
jgi:transcriptional regulator with XRE-family HTH domain